MNQRLVALAVVAVSTAIARESAAIERQHHIGLGPMMSLLKVDDKSTMDVGGGAGIHYTYGLNDQLNLMGEASFAIVAANQKQDEPSSPHTRPAELDHVAFGVGYVIDVLRWVPYACALASGYRLAGGTLDHAQIIGGGELGLGLDYELSRSWAVGIAGRQHFLLTQFSTYPTYTTVLLRLEYMWGY